MKSTRNIKLGLGIGFCIGFILAVSSNSSAIVGSSISPGSPAPIATNLVGVVPVANGGTNLSSSPDDQLMVGNGTTWQAKTLPTCTGSASAVLYDTATNAWTCNQSITASGLSATLAVASGGTNLTAALDDATIVGNGTTWQSKALPTCTGSGSAVLYDTATNAWACNQSITASGLSATLAVASGGTNLTAALDDNVIVGNGTTWQSKAMPDCATSTSALQYTAATNALSCGTISPGGLTKFTEAENAAGVNATVPVESLTALNGAVANLDAAFVPKGTGALLAQVPDGAIAAGNKRGTYAVDLQLNRAAATDVASGAYSTISGGQSNLAGSTHSNVGGGFSNSITTGSYSTIGGGYDNTITVSQSVIAGGDRNTISSPYSAICGGVFNYAQNQYTFVGGGTGNYANGVYSAVIGGSGNRADANYSTAMGNGAKSRNNGRVAFSSDQYSVAGDTQASFQVTQARTIDTTVTKMTSDGTAMNTLNIGNLIDSSALGIRVQVIARETSTGDIKVWELTGAVKRAAGAATTAFVGTPTSTVIAADAATTAWAAVLDVDATTSGGGFYVKVTGEAKTIRWAAVSYTVELVD